MSDLAPPFMTDQYRAGVAYVDNLHAAATAAATGDLDTANRLAFEADCALGPLGEEGDPERLRDFIAGTAFASEHYLRRLGVRIQADG